jgi:addiction module HigA family antidote
MGQKTWRLKIPIREEKNKRRPIHPGVILGEELQALHMSLSALATAIGVVPNRISQIVAGKRDITADTALRLARFFGVSPDFWMNLQKTYELDLAIREHGAEIETSFTEEALLTRLAMRSQNHVKASPIGSPIRLCMGSFPLATSAIPNTAAPTYIIPSQNRRRRRYRGSRSARSTDLHTRHNIQASTAVATETPAITNAIVPGPTALTESVCTASLHE